MLVLRIERLAYAARLSDALLGALAALAADSPEITSAVSAIVHGQRDVGAGVVLGSAVFNLTALVGLGAVAARGLPVGRHVVALGGTVTVALTGLALLTVGPGVAPAAMLGCALGLLGGYLLLLGAGPRILRPFLGPRPGARPAGWLLAAVTEEELAEEQEFETAAEVASLRREPVRRAGVVAGGALIIVIAASVAMERAATSLGSRWDVPGIITGAVVLGAVTGIPNAVASIHLARKRNGTGALSTALNSNNFNIVLGLLIPAAVAGDSGEGGGTLLVALWCLALTAFGMSVAHRRGMLSRGVGFVVLAAYGAFVATVVVSGLP